MNNEKELKELKALEALLNNMPKEEISHELEDRLLKNVFNVANINTFNTEEISEDNFARTVKNQKRNFRQVKKLKAVGYVLMLVASLFIFVMYSPDIFKEDKGDPKLNELSPGELHKMMCDAYIEHEKALMTSEAKSANASAYSNDADYVAESDFAEAPALDINTDEADFEEAAPELAMTGDAGFDEEVFLDENQCEIAETETMTNGGMLIYGVEGTIETTKPELYHHSEHYRNTLIIIVIINLLSVF